MVSVVDYFFGAHVTPQQQRLRAVARNGVAHASEIAPRDPTPGQPVSLKIVSDAALPINHIAAYFTTDGSDPAGARGLATVGKVALAERVAGEPMLWDAEQRADVLAHARWLIHQRAARDALCHGQLKRIPLSVVADEPEQVGALARYTAHEAILFIFNNGERAARFMLEPARLAFIGEMGWAEVAIERAWRLNPDNIGEIDAPGWAGSLPPLSATMFVLHANQGLARPASAQLHRSEKSAR